MKSYDELTIQDDFMFGKVMQDINNLRPLLERIFPEIDFTGLKLVMPQMAMNEYYESHGIRVDIFTEDNEHVFSVEMQVAKKVDLPKRTRYYQAVMDMHDLVKGERYAALRKQYIIFICPGDPFDDNIMVYTYRNVCEETEEELGDDTEKIFINCSGKNAEEYPLLRPFAEYVNGKASEDGYILQLEKCVREAKMNPLWRKEFMDLREKLYLEREEGREEGWKKGKEEGREEGRAEGLSEGLAMRNEQLIRSLSRKGKSPEEIADLLDLEIEKVNAVMNS
jgi:predicted transposase/invertase (TIGR01784 family)